MSFRKIKILLNESQGAYVQGEWVAGTRTVSTVMASVQPVSKMQDMQALPEGRHMSDFCMIFSDARLVVTADGENTQPDIVVHEGYGYEIIDIAPYRSDVINHYKYLAAKVFKYTTGADWINGTLRRP